ncbi:hypothetical protein LY76DRAFT_305263 [Colletotrichum caudatum]|nr:hypothetical protein LY76DRAFT_305263 [Colletotrichum caudatum]
MLLCQSMHGGQVRMETLHNNQEIRYKVQSILSAIMGPFFPSFLPSIPLSLLTFSFPDPSLSLPLRLFPLFIHLTYAWLRLHSWLLSRRFASGWYVLNWEPLPPPTPAPLHSAWGRGNSHRTNEQPRVPFFGPAQAGQARRTLYRERRYGTTHSMRTTDTWVSTYIITRDKKHRPKSALIVRTDL